MNIKSIKKTSRKHLKNHLTRSILVCFILAIIIGGGLNFNTSGYLPKNSKINTIMSDFKGKNNLDVVTTFTDNIGLKMGMVSKYKPTRGVLSVFFNQITGTGSIVFGVLNAVNHLTFNISVSKTIFLILGLIIYFLLFVFLQNVIIVGKDRYFIEHCKYEDVGADKLLFVYRVEKTKNVAKIMLLRAIKQILWNLTIIGGVIKYYEYEMIPYILAENPTISSKDCFALSKKMSNKIKFNLFLIDLSFFGWYLLGLLTLGLSTVIYSKPYKESVMSETYFVLRKKYYSENKDLFKDANLNITYSHSSYPNYLYFIEEIPKKKWLNIDYNDDYSWSSYVLMFFVFSLIGWLWEVSLHLFSTGEFVNRGTMFGPILPIYGWGGVLMLILLKKLKKNPFKLFLASFLLCGVIEYSTAWYLETFKHMKWWDYTGYFLNINGRVCLEGLIVFGLGGCLATYFLGPLLNNLFKKLNYKLKTVLIIILIVLFSIDSVYSHFHPNTGEGVSTSAKNFNIKIIKKEKNV